MKALVIIMFFLCFFLLRNVLIYKFRTKALKKTTEEARAAVIRGEDWKIYFKKYDNCESYSCMFYDITRWKYRQFYPDI